LKYKQTLLLKKEREFILMITATTCKKNKTAKRGSRRFSV